MPSGPPGKTTSPVEVTNISGNGIWLRAAGKEQFLSFDDFPWFRNAPVARVLHVEEPSPGHYYWPELDVDLSSDIIAHPGRFPLTGK